MVLDFNQTVSIPEDVLFRNLEGEAVLLHLGSEEYFGLDAVGTTMWQEMTRRETIEDAYEAMLSTYDVEGDQLRRDMDDFVQELLDARLITVA